MSPGDPKAYVRPVTFDALGKLTELLWSHKIEYERLPHGVFRLSLEAAAIIKKDGVDLQTIKKDSVDTAHITEYYEAMERTLELPQGLIEAALPMTP